MTSILPQPVILPKAVTLPQPVTNPDAAAVVQEPEPVTVPAPEPVAEHNPGALAALKVTCKQEDLARGLTQAMVAVLEHSTLPILKDVLITTDRGRLRLSATSLEVGVQVWIDAEIHTEGTTVVPAARFKKLISTLGAGQVQLAVSQGSQTLTITSLETRTTIRSASDAREFPVIPCIEGGQQTATLDAGLLKTMIDQVEYAADKDLQQKPKWASIKLVIAEGIITLAAADTFKLAERMAPLAPDALSRHADILVPARNLAKLADILPSQGTVTLMVTGEKNQVIFHFEQGEQVEFVSRLIDADYPNYKQALPNQHSTRAVVDTKPLVKATERAAIFAVDDKKSVRLTFRPSGGNGALSGSLVVDADDASLGDSVSPLAAEVSGPEQVVFFPVENLQQALAHIDTPQVAFEIRETGKPVILKPVGDIAYVNLLQTMFSPKTAA